MHGYTLVCTVYVKFSRKLTFLACSVSPGLISGVNLPEKLLHELALKP